jgi:hypothetical protein
VRKLLLVACGVDTLRQKEEEFAFQGKSEGTHEEEEYEA